MTTPSTATKLAAADAVVEYALISLQEQFLRWEKDVNMQVAEFVWNTGGIGLESAHLGPEPAFRDLVRTLARARRCRWGHEDFMLLDLDVRHASGELVFTFDLSWDEGDSVQGFEIVAELPLAGPAQKN